MRFQTVLAASVAAFLAVPALAADIEVTGAYARIMPGAMAGAAFMTIENHGAADDRLVDAASDIAMKVELHTHVMAADGTAQMRHVPEGFVVPAGGSHALARGGDHVMFMGLKPEARQAATVTVTLTFEKAGTVTLDIPVDNAR